MPKVAGKEVRSAHTKKCCFSSCRRWPPSAYKHFGTHRGEQFVANKKAILSRHGSIQSIAVSSHVHMYAYICIYSCMHRLFLHMIYNRWDKPLDLYRALRHFEQSLGQTLGFICWRHEQAKAHACSPPSH